MYTIYTYTANNGDGSSGICWFLDSSLDEDRFVDYDFETWCDGDGCGPKLQLVFKDEETAIAAGIPRGIGYFNYRDKK